MDEFARIQTFIRVVDAGSFSAAARLDSSISSVARQVKSLEDEWGVRLLNRSTRSLSLTEPGRLFYERFRAIANELSNAKLAAKSCQEGVKGVLKVSLRVSAGTTIIVPALPTLLKQYPELTVDISLTDEKCDLVANDIDVAVWMGKTSDLQVVARRLSPSQKIVCATPDYFTRHNVPRFPKDLRRHNCIVFTASSYRSAWAFEKDGQHEEIEPRGHIRTDNALVLLSAAMADLGLILVHEWMVRALLSQRRLVRVLADYTVTHPDGDAELYAVYPSSRSLSLKVRVFVDFLVEQFNGPEASIKATTTQALPHR